LTYRTLEDWGRSPSPVPQPLPVAVVLFSPAAVRDFLKDLLARNEADEDWDLPPTLKERILREMAEGKSAAAGETAS
jgi:hypothetical protein